ncbi:hypothetical protein [Accumulibacter sp.]|uniref:hypothetical protein n=1 Tax=Accumulibacter sp. TaxID=2053492 RepID=UPI0025DC08AE|nr:hypothetical protein [Accumulibacter sp.]MCM8612525.1 hypothetical protein [Accumulibacter sp.]MCM8636444.1 hypothetical protein [Accumulibacter sp.]MCM8640157.1 hypothetical protein [Accumulibacter sp.]
MAETRDDRRSREDLLDEHALRNAWKADQGPPSMRAFDRLRRSGTLTSVPASSTSSSSLPSHTPVEGLIKQADGAGKT